ncbi:hypothetical protein [Clostridium sp.]|jgi:lipoprotein NlpI|uniref:hypothetical protein n=1 Tax=Clostridium sp. TaxID=1506 RepID=UPI0025B9E18E|nr:hypothetical protein [Clostridium sp.]
MRQEIIYKRSLSNQVRQLINSGEYEVCYDLIIEEMVRSPHSPEPHNLLGILLEKRRNHLLAMKHFRVASDLDPTYLPAIHNLNIYGSFYPSGKVAFDESDFKFSQDKNLYKL